MPGTVNCDAELLQSLLKVGFQLSTLPCTSEMLDVIITEACKLARAEAGTLYVNRKNRLVFAAARNEKLTLPDIAQKLLDKQTPVSSGSLVGYVASTGKVLNIPDAYCLPEGVKFRHNRRFDQATGYRTKSVLAMPLKRPDGNCVGVLELINCRGENGEIVSFQNAEGSGLMSLASMAAVTIHNAILQEEIKDAHLGTIISLSVAAEFRDDATAGHIKRMSRTSAIIARSLGMPDKIVELLEYASPMHDVGKIGIPDSILLKPGPLTAEQREVMEKHTLIGARILSDCDNELISTAHDIALSHHEKWDSSGYPNSLMGNKIPLSARIAALADVFDALVTKRCYKNAYPLEMALDIINREKGRHFDPDIVKAFIDILDDINVLDGYDGVESGQYGSVSRPGGDVYGADGGKIS